MRRDKKLSLLLFIMLQGIQNFAQETKSNLIDPAATSDREIHDEFITEEKSSELELPFFGSQLFNQSSVFNSNVAGGSLPENYLLGPGDRLGVYLGGKTGEHFELVISSDGKVYLPQAGVFFAQGMTLPQFQKQLDGWLSGYFSNYNVNVMLITPKIVRVNVVGEVHTPGNFSLSALNTVLDAVLCAKSTTEIGSFRDIQVYREGEPFVRVDLYDFLLCPDKRTEIFLQNDDRIYVPVRQEQISVTGEVFRPAAFELCPWKEERLSDILILAGDMKDIAYKPKIELSRLTADGRRVLHFYDFDSLSQTPQDFYNPVLKNNDRVHVYSILDQLPERIVTIHGEVKKPGEYALEENMHVGDLILRAGSLTRRAYLPEAQVSKVDPKQPAITSTINLEKALSGDPNHNILLEADDHVFIRRIPEWLVGPLVTLSGEINFPGVYTIIKDSTTLSEIIHQAGGFTDEAHLREAKLIRRHQPEVEDKEFERLKAMTREQMSDLEYEYFVMRQNNAEVREIVLDFERLFKEGDPSQDVILKEGDVIQVPRAVRVVLVTGRISKPGGILYAPGAGIRYYIDKAGGYSWDAHPRRTKVIKASGEIMDDQDVDQLQPGDRIWVPRKPDRDYWQIFRDIMLVAGQLATVYLVIQNTVK
ncbi:SLBB domain-containing protein [candidate division KSB1 bacterium]|nr:SLBB domain-containing protein [candidate division KSB1 bacterium]